METNQILTIGLIIMTMGFGWLVYSLILGIEQLKFVIAQLPKHIKEGTEVVVARDNANVRSGDVVFHIPNSLFGDRDISNQPLPDSLR